MQAPRAKVRLQSISTTGAGSAQLNMVSDYNAAVPEDVAISAVFPTATVFLVCVDLPTIQGLTVGAAYYVDFSFAAVQPTNVLNK